MDEKKVKAKFIQLEAELNTKIDKLEQDILKRNEELKSQIEKIAIDIKILRQGGNI